MNYEEFLAKFKDHIEGQANNDRQMRESNFGDEVKSSRSKSAKGRGLKGNEKSGGKSEYEKEDSNSRSQIASRASLRNDNSHVEEINKKFEEERMSLPEACTVLIPKSARIEKLEAKYQLLCHPYPQIEGEMLILQLKSSDTNEKDMVGYRDFSLRKRMPTRAKPTLSATEILRQKKDEKLTKNARLQCLEVDLLEPLCQAEWSAICEVLNHTQGLAWF